MQFVCVNVCESANVAELLQPEENTELEENFHNVLRFFNKKNI